MSDRLLARAARYAPAMLLALMATPVLALAHAVVFPRVSAPGAYEKYVLRVPNERDVATTRVALAFPPEVTVVSFADVAGWELAILTDAGGRITGASWTGELPVGRFVEFPFVAVNPRSETRIRWNATQTYAGGEEVAWAGPEDSASPASFTTIVDAPAVPTASPRTPWLAMAGLVVALVALGVALRNRG
jgi:uncharacterized protein YcnI